MCSSWYLISEFDSSVQSVYLLCIFHTSHITTSVRQFNNYSDEIRLKILSDIIEEGLSNVDSLTFGSIPMIFSKIVFSRCQISICVILPICLANSFTQNFMVVKIQI